MTYIYFGADQIEILSCTNGGSEKSRWIQCDIFTLFRRVPRGFGVLVECPSA